MCIMKKIRNAMGRHLNYPINPFMISSIGLFSIVWSLWILIPKNNSATLITYKVFTMYGINYLMFICAFLIGLWLFLTPLFAKSIDSMTRPLTAMGIFWLAIGIFVAVGDWTTNTWLIYVFLTIYCLLSAANFRVNRDSSSYEGILRQ